MGATGPCGKNAVLPMSADAMRCGTGPAERQGRRYWPPSASKSPYGFSCPATALPSPTMTIDCLAGS